MIFDGKSYSSSRQRPENVDDKFSEIQKIDSENPHKIRACDGVKSNLGFAKNRARQLESYPPMGEQKADLTPIILPLAQAKPALGVPFLL